MERFAHTISRATGSPPAMLLATAACVAWPVIDRSFDLLDGVSALSLWMLFVLQISQNRDTTEMLNELRELVRAIPEADEGVIPEEGA